MNAVRAREETLDDLQVDDQAAVLTLAWCLRRNVNERLLLSATVDVGPAGLFDGVATDLQHYALSRRYRLFFRRYVLSGAEGLRWYQSCAARSVRLPDEEGGHPLQTMCLLAEPPWPGLMFRTKSLTPGSVLPQQAHRTCSLIPDRVGWQEAFWDETETDRALSWLGEMVEWDFWVDPEELGAARLLLVDPDLANVSVTRDLAPRSRGFGIRVKGNFRSAPVSGYTFTLHRHRPRGAEASISFPLTEEQVVELPHEPETFSYDVVHDRRGLVVQDPPMCFLEGVNISLGIVMSTRNVKIAASGDRQEDNYSVQLVNEPDIVRMATNPQSITAAKLLAANYARREKRLPPYQQWFEGDADAAATTLRDLIKGTATGAWIVDPYFDETELGRFALAVGHTAAPIKILTSAEGLRTNAKRDSVPAGARLGARARAVTQGAAAQKRIEIRVMTGVRPDVHDRFLMVDEALWLLGSSLNEFGSRGTMLVAVPDPRAVSEKIQEAWERAIALDDWLAARAVRRRRRWWGRRVAPSRTRDGRRARCRVGGGFSKRSRTRRS